MVMNGLTVATIVGSPPATRMGQTVGGRNAYRAISAPGVLSLLAWAGVALTLGGLLLVLHILRWPVAARQARDFSPL